MYRLDDLTLIERPESREAALALLVHVAFSDGMVQEKEFAFLEELLPGVDASELLVKMQEIGDRPLDLRAIGAALGSGRDRRRALQFAARMAWQDRQLGVPEKAVLVEIAAGLELPSDSVETVLAEMVGQGVGAVTPADVRSAVAGVDWPSNIRFVAGDLLSAPFRWPSEEVLIGSFHVEGREPVVVTEGGIAAAFRERKGFARWSDIASYTRVPVFGAALRLFLKDGECLTLSDVRFSAIATLLDALFARRA